MGSAIEPPQPGAQLPSAPVHDSMGAAGGGREGFPGSPGGNGGFGDFGDAGDTAASSTLGNVPLTESLILPRTTAAAASSSGGLDAAPAVAREGSSEEATEPSAAESAFLIGSVIAEAPPADPLTAGIGDLTTAAPEASPALLGSPLGGSGLMGALGEGQVQEPPMPPPDFPPPGQDDDDLFGEDDDFGFGPPADLSTPSALAGLGLDLDLDLDMPGVGSAGDVAEGGGPGTQEGGQSPQVNRVPLGRSPTKNCKNDLDDQT